MKPLLPQELRRLREPAMARRRSKAAMAVAKAIKKGELPPASSLLCVDCGKQAKCYDHRDYNKPLEVSAVCKRCDCIRGPGEPYDGLDPRWVKKAKSFAGRRVVIEDERFKALAKKRAERRE